MGVFFTINNNIRVVSYKDIPIMFYKQDNTYYMGDDNLKDFIVNYCDGTKDITNVALNLNVLDNIYELENLGCIEKNGTQTFKEVYMKHFDNNYVSSIHFEITNKCNFNCSYCYLNCNDNSEDLSLEDIKNIINQMAETGIFNISLSGGEPLVRKDFWDIVDFIEEKKISLRQIYSNGSLFDDIFYKNLEKRNWLQPMFCLSFDDIDNRYRKNIQNNKVLETIEKLSKNYEVVVTSTLGKNSVKDALSTFKILKNYPIDWKINIIDGEKIQKETFSSQEEKYEFIFDSCVEIYNSLENFGNLKQVNFMALFSCGNNKKIMLPNYYEEYKTCEKAKRFLILQYNGKIKNCYQKRENGVNILEKKLKDVIFDIEKPIFSLSNKNNNLRPNKQLRKKTFCESCSIKNHCVSKCFVSNIKCCFYKNKKYTNFIELLKGF